MSPLLVGELRARPPRKWTHHSSTSAAAVAASARAALAGAGTAISSGDGEESKSSLCKVKLLAVQSMSVLVERRGHIGSMVWLVGRPWAKPTTGSVIGPRAEWAE